MLRKLISTALTLVAALGGCTRYDYVQTRVLVVDAETRQPIAGARVGVGYLGWPMGPWDGARGMTRTTDSQGIALFEVTVDSGASVYPGWHVLADGYMDLASGDEAREPHQQIERLLKAGDRTGTVDVTLERFASPLPTIEVVIPNDYRGFVRICIAGPPDPSPTKRLFSCPIDDTGRALVPTAKILTTKAPIERVHSFVFANGERIPMMERFPLPDGDAFGAWPLWFVDGCEVTIIGNEADAAAERHALWPSGVVDNSTYGPFRERVLRGRFEVKGNGN